MWPFFLSVSVFLIAHIVPSYRPLRRKLVAKMGERVFMSVYGVISLFLFGWLIQSYKVAPYTGLWDVTDPLRLFALFIMFWVCLLLVCTFTQPNPFSLGIGKKGFDPKNAGIVRITKHPAFVAFALWSCAHIIPNGDVASVLFFGLMAGLSFYGPYSLNAKRREKMGADVWQNLANSVEKGWPEIGVWRWIGAIILFGALVLAHEPIIGVAPYYF